MTEIEQILCAVTQALSGDGYSVIRAYPRSGAARWSHPVVAVSIKAGSQISTGFGEYLGVKNDPERGALELYGKRVELTVAADIYSPKDMDNGAQKCAQVFAAICTAAGALPQGIKCGGVSCQETELDGKTGMFLCRCELKLQAYLYAEDDGESGQILDFRLKGEAV